ncbi:MAG: hypothetical protein HN712_23940 [Gemmatimonadetes bacterium]|jgi:hypothetical protein|nr:hypothetical protein [Gemmatimonadota bacterium]MBT6145552.1 hypothetical protein [Gemmatimonadota bacterium]MBT7863390.1 hypothetical protein [Gemmatimonadota bacterium]
MTATIQDPKTTRTAHLRPIVFDLLAHFEPSAHFQFSRRVRNEFDELAKEYTRSTWLLGRYGGRPVMQTDIQGIGVASRVEIGRLVLREGKQAELIGSAMQMFAACQEHDLASGPISRVMVHFPKASERPKERDVVRQAFDALFHEADGDGSDSCFLAWEIDHLEIGRCVAYQSLTQYLREDGIYHSCHRARVDAVQRHLQQEVGRYESHRFFVRPERRPEDTPSLTFCYTGDAPDRTVEAFMAGYTEEALEYVPADEYQERRSTFSSLSDYERASRRFGGLWILQDDIVRKLTSQQVGAIYLFFDENLQPQINQEFTWDELYQRQRSSAYIPRASRNSQTFLDMVLEEMVRRRFITVDDGHYRLAEGFHEYQHVTFYQLDDYRKRQV